MLERMELPANVKLEMAEGALHRMWEPIREAVQDRLIPGAAAAVLWRGHKLCYAAGLAVDTPGLKVPVQLDTIYDCASLTKVTVTLPLVLMLASEGKLALDDPVAAYFPEFNAADKLEITIRHLLAHTSGLQAGADFHTRPWSMNEIVSELASRPLAYKPGTNAVYSDLGFILLGELVARKTGMPLDSAARRYLWKPLGMDDSGFCPPEALWDRTAATEYSADIGACWRGIVHDENARAFGGVSGHAGLFATAADLLRYAAMWLNDAMWLNGAGERTPALLAEPLQAAALSTQTPPLADVNRGLGWVLKGDNADVSGALSTREAFGHTGFTGTSIMVDPGRELAVVLLTNRVHYGRDRNIGKLRREFHDAVANAFLTDGASE